MAKPSAKPSTKPSAKPSATSLRWCDLGVLANCFALVRVFHSQGLEGQLLLEGPKQSVLP